MSQPDIVKKSLLSKIKSVIYPKKTDKKPPVVHKETRGRPTKQTQEQRKQNKAKNKPQSTQSQHTTYEDALRHSYVMESQESIVDSQQSRHSSYIPSVVSSDVKPKTRRGRKSVSNVEEASNDKEFPLMAGDLVQMNNIVHFKGELPPWVHPYISLIEDVQPDGNCGFRSVARGLGFPEEAYHYVRHCLVEELDHNQQFWENILDSIFTGHFNHLRHTINWTTVGHAPPSHWMEMPYSGLVIAQRFRVTVHLIGNTVSETYFPLTYGPDRSRQIPEAVSFAFVNNNHYIRLSLGNDYPMPEPNSIWRRFRNQEAEEWKTLYEEQIEHFRRIIRKTKPPGFVDLT